MVILDTSVIIDHLRQPGKFSRLQELVTQSPRESLALSVVSIQELYEGKSTKDDKREKDLLSTIATLTILPYTYETAKIAGELTRDGGPLEFADAAIAATAIINGFQLLTLNEKDFSGIEDLDLYRIDSKENTS